MSLVIVGYLASEKKKVCVYTRVCVCVSIEDNIGICNVFDVLLMIICVIKPKKLVLSFVFVNLREINCLNYIF